MPLRTQRQRITILQWLQVAKLLQQSSISSRPGQMRGGEALTSARPSAGAPTSSRRLQNCASSFSAASAAAATGGIKTASPRSMAATPSSPRQSPMPKTILIPIPISKSSAPRFRNSVEGLNQEIERITIQDSTEKEDAIVTPSGGGLSGSHSNCSSRPDSISPSYLTVVNDVGGGSPYEDKELGPYSPLPKYAASPRPNNSYMFKREPPEGCERVKVFEEGMPRPLQEIPPFLCPDRNKVNFIPNSGSAFCLVSILKPLLPAPELSFRP
ncbi:unnamed protein product, partial [Tetraodon nigroviridis]